MWVVTGALLAASILAMFSFGLALLPMAILAGIAAARLRFWPDVLGAGLGVASAVLWLAIVNFGFLAASRSGGCRRACSTAQGT
jgi:cation transporter-like permease